MFNLLYCFKSICKLEKPSSEKVFDIQRSLELGFLVCTSAVSELWPFRVVGNNIHYGQERHLRGTREKIPLWEQNIYRMRRVKCKLGSRTINDRNRPLVIIFIELRFVLQTVYMAPLIVTDIVFTLRLSVQICIQNTVNDLNLHQLHWTVEFCYR